MNELINNNNNNILDNYINNEHQVVNRSKSFEKLSENHNFKKRNKRKDLYHSYNEIKNKEEKNEFDSYYNTINKESRLNHYSISNIANIKLNKVILPEYISKREINRTKSFISENKGTMYISNDLSSTIPQKSIYYNDNSSVRKKSVFNISKIKKQNARKNKTRDKNLVHSARTIYKKEEKKNPEKVNPLTIIKLKLKNNNIKNLNIFKKGKKCNLSFDKEKNSKEEQTQVGFRKIINLKKKIGEFILINHKNFKKNRKINL